MGAGELAVRQGSIVNYNRQGNVLWMDDFQSTTWKWKASYVGGAGASARSVETAHQGDACAKLTVVNVQDARAMMWKRLMYSKTGNIGLSAAFTADLDIVSLMFSCMIYTGTTVYRMFLKFNFGDYEITVMNNQGQWIVIENTFDPIQDIDFFYQFKLIGDFEGYKYSKLFFRDVEYDLSAIAMSYVASGTYPHLRIEAEITNGEAVEHFLYIDNVIVTQNEP